MENRDERVGDDALTADPLLAEDLQLIKETQSDFDFLEANYARLQQDYPGQCVAIKDGAVVAHDENLQRVLDEIGRRGIDASRVVLERVFPPDVALVV